MSPRHRRHRTRTHPWLRNPAVPVALLVVTVAGSGLAARAEQAPAAPAVAGIRSPITPVLSVRRAPELVAAPVADRRLRAHLEGLLAITPGTVCLSVEAGGRTIYATNPTAPLVPASLQKLLTAEAALTGLGSDTTLTTTVRATGGIDDGVVNGDLYFVGGGDPLIMTEVYYRHFRIPPPVRTSLESLADNIVAAGVRQITGGIVGDDSRYDRSRFVPGWPDRFTLGDETGPLSALTVNDAYTEFPPIPELRVPDETPAADPPAHAADQLGQLLTTRGVQIGAPASSGQAPPDTEEIASVTSAPMKDLVAEMLRDSDNQTAELLLKELGLQKNGQGSTQAGLAAMQDQLRSLGLPLDGITMVDGSGLASENQQTCQLVMAVLGREGPTSVLGQGLPIAGQTGTLEKRMVDTPADGRVKAKTGTLNQVNALAGFVESAQGVAITFSYLFNVAPPDRVGLDDIALGDQLAVILVGYPEGPDLTKLGPVPVT